MRHASKLKWRPKFESGKTIQALPLKGLAGKQWRQAEKLSLFLRGECRVTALCSSRRNYRDTGTSFSRILDLQTLCSLDRAAAMPEQVGYRRSTILTWLLLRRVRVCRILVPEGTATKRSIPLEGSGSSDAFTEDQGDSGQQPRRNAFALLAEGARKEASASCLPEKRQSTSVGVCAISTALL